MFTYQDEGSRLALEQFENWLQSTRDVSRRAVFHCWIFLLGAEGWKLGRDVLQWYDIAFETFTYELSSILSTMMGVKKNYRQTVDTYLHRALIKECGRGTQLCDKSTTENGWQNNKKNETNAFAWNNKDHQISAIQWILI